MKDLLEVPSFNTKYYVSLRQIWVVLLIVSSNQKRYPDLVSDTSSVWNFCAHSQMSFHWETCNGAPKCWPFSQAPQRVSAHNFKLANPEN